MKKKSSNIAKKEGTHVHIKIIHKMSHSNSNIQKLPDGRKKK